MRRVTRTLMLFTLAPLLMGGGLAPPTTAPTPGKTDVTAVMAIDTHNVTPTALEGSITIVHKKKVVGTVFNLPEAEFVFGCDLSLTETRFVNRRLQQFGIPDATIVSMFSEIGFTVSAPSPFVQEILNQSCTPASVDGVLTVEVVIGFIE